MLSTLRQVTYLRTLAQLQDYMKKVSGNPLIDVVTADINNS